MYDACAMRVCCVLCVVCCVLCVVCGVWCVVCGVWCVVCGVWRVVCGVWCVVRCAMWCCGAVVLWWCGGVVVVVARTIERVRRVCPGSHHSMQCLARQPASHRKHPQVSAPHLTTKLHRMTEHKNCHVGVSVEIEPGHEPDKARKPNRTKPPTEPSQEARTPIDTGSEGEVTDTLDGSTLKAPWTNKA